jgi:hypothetical protein
MSESLNIPVPSPDHVRELLSRNLHERDLLRKLLRISEKTVEVRQSFQGDSAFRSIKTGGNRS